MDSIEAADLAVVEADAEAPGAEALLAALARLAENWELRADVAEEKAVAKEAEAEAKESLAVGIADEPTAVFIEPVGTEAVPTSVAVPVAKVDAPEISAVAVPRGLEVETVEPSEAVIVGVHSDTHWL